MTPIRLIIHATAEVLAFPLGGSGRPRASADLSEEEFRTLVDAGSAQGQVDARERRLIHRVFEFGDKNIGQVMTPRDKVFALDGGCVWGGHLVALRLDAAGAHEVIRVKCPQTLVPGKGK